MNPITYENGQASWSDKAGDTYLVTGVDRRGKRFRFETEFWPHAAGINVWRGSKWLVRDGKRYRILKVEN